MPTECIIVVEKRSDFRWDDSDLQLITAEEFIAELPQLRHRQRKVINLCRSFEYQGIGYYCSLLAQARDDRITPSMETLIDLKHGSVSAPVFAELTRCIGPDVDLPRSLSTLTLQVMFGQIEDAEWANLARKTFEQFRCPLLEIHLERQEGANGWGVTAVRSLDLRDIDPSRDAFFLHALNSCIRQHWRPTLLRARPRMNLAVLHQPRDPLAPSSLETLEKFKAVGRDMNIAVELIEKKDFPRLTQFDALFIRETTAVTHHTFKFARKAALDGMPVIDDPDSIVKCTNKAFLADMLNEHQIAVPRTQFVSRSTLAHVERQLSYPVVLKVPDGAFSLGVKKADNGPQFRAMAQAMLKASAIILVQEFMYTEFDWRIGVLGGQALFAARYHMCRGHWQILRHTDDGGHAEGRTEAVKLGDTPTEVLQAALAATRLLGDGLYGVDLKQTAAGVFVIEINDNPNINLGAEDAILGDEIYGRVLNHLLQSHERGISERRATAPQLTNLADARHGKLPLPRIHSGARPASLNLQ
ncbi:MAG: RimK family protein [Burkholderiaceae bacterium]|nr:RimK family protein [Roseateles sp.]MBV8468441.1 RimK family protein [Burkholderiaceae bacterium]